MEALERRPALAEEGSLLRAVHLGYFDRSNGAGLPRRPNRVAAVQFSGPGASLGPETEPRSGQVPLLLCARESEGVWSLKTA